MEAETIEHLVNSVGFPILCVLGLAIFIYRFTMYISEQNKSREERLYTMLGKNQEQLDKLEDVNAEFVSVLNQFKQDNVDIKKDLEDIKETVKRLPKRKTDKEETNNGWNDHR